MKIRVRSIVQVACVVWFSQDCCFTVTANRA
jgi:hypothetical protein